MTNKPRSAEDVAKAVHTEICQMIDKQCSVEDHHSISGSICDSLQKFRDDGVKEAQANIDSLERGKIYDVAFQLGMKKGLERGRATGWIQGDIEGHAGEKRKHQDPWCKDHFAVIVPCPLCVASESLKLGREEGFEECKAKASKIAYNFNPSSILAKEIDLLQPDGKEGV